MRARKRSALAFAEVLLSRPPEGHRVLNEVATVIQTASWAVAVVGGGFAIWKHFADSKEKRLWEKVKLAKQMLDQLEANPRAIDAAYMIGAWPRRAYRSAESLEPFELTERQLIVALTPAWQPKTRNEQYVRECFDNLLFNVEQCIGASEQRLVEWEQLRPMLVTLFVGASQRGGSTLSEYASHLGYQRCAQEIPKLVMTALTECQPDMAARERERPLCAALKRLNPWRRRSRSTQPFLRR